MPAVPLPSPEILNLLILALALSASLVTGFLVRRFVLRPLEQMKQRLSDERAQFEARAHDDPLTGLLNRRAFDERLDAELRRAAREYYSVAVAIVKLETDGAHIELTQQLRRELRAGDIAGRVGDGEFALALVRADAHAGARVLARMNDALPGVTFSSGIAEFPRDGRAPADVLSKADQARAWGDAGGHGPVTIFAPAGHDDASSPQESAEAARERSLVPTLEGIAREVDSK